jgi:Lrp/AsnC family transcriptional regulator for asnA, asnC and gidA
MDRIDLEIAKILSENARIPFRKIAEQLEISPQMVIRRYRRLRKTVFAYSSVTVNLEKLGFKASAGFCLKISKEKQEEITQIYNKITKFPNVIVAGRLLGSVDMCFLVPLRSFEEVFDFQQRLSEIEGIEEVDITLYKIHKNWPRQLYSNLLPEQP